MEIKEIFLKNLLNESEISQVNIDERSFNKILTTHYDNGFIIITSYRNENTSVQNKLSFEELKRDVRSAGFSFIPVYGGFIENKGSENEVEVKEPALLIPNYQLGTNKRYEDMNAIKKLGLELVRKFNQDSFLIKLPQIERLGADAGKAYYINKNNQVVMSFDGKSINDLTQDYFTKLHKNDNNKAPKRFTFTEKLYVNESATSLSNAQVRYGELFIKFK